MWTSLWERPRGQRIQEKPKLTALQLRSDGTWENLALNGLADIKLWTMSYDLMCTVLIMFDVVDLGPPTAVTDQVFDTSCTRRNQNGAGADGQIVARSGGQERAEKAR